MTKVKICGITNPDDAFMSAACGADFLGFVFYKGSQRFITPQIAKKIIETLPPSVLKVGVFVNEEASCVREIAKVCSLDFLQFHGDESQAYINAFKAFRIIKAFRVKDSSFLTELESFDPELFLFDTFKKEAFGGTGQTFDWHLLESLKELKKHFIVSGGLTPENVTGLIERIQPFGVDVSSGVEKSPGKKNCELVKKFIEIVKDREE